MESSVKKVARLRRQNKKLRLMIRTALSKIPQPIRCTEDYEESPHWYSRVSERTIQEVEQALGLKHGK